MKLSDCHPEEGVYDEVSEEMWWSYLNERGQVEDNYELRKVTPTSSLNRSFDVKLGILLGKIVRLFPDFRIFDWSLCTFLERGKTLSLL